MDSEALSLFSHTLRYLVVTSVLTSAWRHLTSGLRSPDEPDEVTGSITRLRFVWFTSNFEHLPRRKPSRKQGMSRIPLSSIFLSENFIRLKSLTRSSGKWYVIRVYKKTTYRIFTQLYLRYWPIRNYSSVQFLCQTLSGNTLEVRTKSIPSVPSVWNTWGSGLLHPSDTWPLR